MPNYDYKCSLRTHIIEINLPVARRHEPKAWICQNCGEAECLTMKFGAPAFADPFGLGIAKPPAHVQDRLKQIKKAHPNAGEALKGSKFGENLSY